MKQNVSFGLLVLGALLAGCSPSSENEMAENPDAAANQLENLKKETGEAAQQASSYAKAKKDAFIATMSRRLEEANREIDQLSDRAAKGGDAAKAEAGPRLRALRDEAAKLGQELEKAKNATESAWKEMEPRMERAYGEMKDRFNQARQWVSEKIAPE